ncbi:MAG: choice-of-anchor L domain-containing protein [Bacteroidota bacterium]
MKHTLILVFSFLFLNVQSQFQVDASQSLNWLIDSVLLGGGVSIQNATFNGQTNLDSTNQIGFFVAENNQDFPLNKGVIMATGNIEVCIGPNDHTGTSLPTTNGISGDSDLEMLDPNVSYNDIAILEFDFIPDFENMIYTYVFGSEEYPEFVGSNFNDAFGFFVSGPGLSGPFSNGAQNVATLPGSGDYVGINTVNESMNDSLYVDNTIVGDSTQCEFDGYTVGLPVVFNVVPGETYHIKMVIGDAMDHAWDSGIFIKNQSFMSVAQLPTSLSENGNLNGKVFIGANPVVDILNLNTSAQLLINGVTIYDLSGKIVEDQNFYSDTSIQMDISGLKAGIYSVVIRTNEGLLTKKIVKE